MRVTRREGIWRLAYSLAVGLVLEDFQPLVGETAKLPSPNDVAGVWHYRSFINNAQKVTDINTLLFGEGDFTFEEETLGELVGTGDFGGGDTVKFRGSVTHGSVLSVRFQGIGSGSSNSDWVYDYFGVLLPAWPNGVGQIPSIVGSVVRSAPHGNGSGGVAQAGKVASFIAVKK